MSEFSARLALPILQPSQAQKHVTHNEALQRLDVLVQMVLEQIGLDTPPATPVSGAAWGVGDAPTGVWSGQAGLIAQWGTAGWQFIDPQEGWHAWDRTDQGLKVYDGTIWTFAAGTQNLPGLGVNAASDATNRFALSSDAALFNHDGAGHQLKLNKASAGDTASLLYQSGFTGHAEMGLAGDNDFSIKVSPDGTTFTQALVVDATTGHVTGAAVQATAADTTPGRLARADYAYGPGNLVGTVGQVGGLPTGAVIENGSNANGRYTRFADGTQICSQHFGSNRSVHDWTYPAAFVNTAAGNLALSALPFGGSALSATVNWTPTSTTAQFRLWNATGNAVASQMHASAVGRWF